jgi:hypothetical protein
MGIKAQQTPTSDTLPSKEIGPGRDDNQLDRTIHRKALLKLDLILLTTVTVIYFLNFLDRCVLGHGRGRRVLMVRTNIGNARPAGLQRDLSLTNRQYSIALTVTYVPYIVAELPLTLALKKMYVLTCLVEPS